MENEGRKLLPQRLVVCYRCLNVYDWHSAPKTKTKRLSVKETECPKCGCKVTMW